jgi:hypothetical protein
VFLRERLILFYFSDNKVTPLVQRGKISLEGSPTPRKGLLRFISKLFKIDVPLDYSPCEKILISNY